LGNGGIKERGTGGEVALIEGSVRKGKERKGKERNGTEDCFRRARGAKQRAKET